MWPFHKHNWAVIGVTHGEFIGGGWGTIVKYKCRKCNKPKTKSLNGTWTLSELQGR